MAEQVDAETTDQGLPPESDQTDDQHGDDSGSSEKASKSWSLTKIMVVAGIAAAILIVTVVFGWPYVQLKLNTVSTDDAYVDGHTTFVAARVAGQIAAVLVEDNNRVSRGDVLAKLDPVPFQTKVSIKDAAVTSAEAELVMMKAEVRAMIAQTRADLFSLQQAMEAVDSQIADLAASVATANSSAAELDLARSNFVRAKELRPSGAISEENYEIRRNEVEVAEAKVKQLLEQIYAARVALGLPAETAGKEDLSDVPKNLDQTFASVRVALSKLIAGAAQYGYDPVDWDAATNDAIEQFFKTDAGQSKDDLYTRIVDSAPSVKQAAAKLLQAKRDLDEAKLHLEYCDVVSEIDGVVTRRNVNPGTNVQAGQSLRSVRSLTEIWVNANFKETQLADLRIGQRVRCEVDMYDGIHDFEGRISGFTMGTGQTLALLPPQNATGNFVKIVQRLPVRIELTDYDPGKYPLFAGVSVEPYVYFKEQPTGENAGEYLQPTIANRRTTVAEHTQSAGTP